MSSCCSPGGAEIRTTFPIDNTARGGPTEPARGCSSRPVLDTVAISAGKFAMGDHWNEGYPQDGETPIHEVALSEFALSATTVTNAQFQQFVDETGYRSTAERDGVSAVFYAAFQGARDDILHQVPGVPWWLAVRGANWRHPNGPGSSLRGLDDHPVVHVSWYDARAFCEWAGGRLPTEAEWEYAARSGLEENRFAWGNDLTPGGEWKCNIWQGAFPQHNSAADGYLTTAPVETYEPNGYGLWQMAGNIWEWCQDWFDPHYYQYSEIRDPQGPESGERRVMRGGSYLCHDSYCNRYRVSARNSNTPDSTSGNVGFRCVIEAPMS